MAHVKKSSRHLLLLASFVTIMAIAGGLFGGIGGVVLALLGHVLLHVNHELAYIMAMCVVLGALSTSGFGLLLVARQLPPRPSLRRSLAAATVTIESN